MTRKKYEADTYHDESSDSSTTSEEPEEIDVDKALDILTYKWSMWNNTSVGDWVDAVDLHTFFFDKQPRLYRYRHKHLILKYEEEMLARLKNFVKETCHDLNIAATTPKVSQVVYHILSRRNDFSVISRSDVHWTKKWSRKLREMERSF